MWCKSSLGSELKLKIRSILFATVLIPFASRAEVEDLYLNKIQPIFAGKCIACHGCNGSPCEMKLDSFAGADRGANRAHQPFGSHIPDLKPMRIKDATTTEEWRAKLFFPVLSRSGDATENLQKSLLYKFVQLGMANNDPKAIDLSSLDNLMEKEAYAIGKRSCPNINEFDNFISKPEHRFAGMPLALPSLTPQEFATLTEWVAAGSPGPSAKAIEELNKLNESEATILAKWENFFNPNASDPPSAQNKTKLVSRFLYEHVVLSHIEIEGIPNRFFEMVRATAPAPQTIKELVTETAMDKVPGGVTFYYRLKPINEVVVQKSLVIWKLNDVKIERLKELFYKVDWKEPVAEVPYITDNPFYNFAQIPTKSRARWILDETKLVTNGMIRGPVCVGPSATYAIRDQFWVFFANPNTDITVLDPTLGSTTGAPGSLERVEFMMKKNFTDFSESEYRRRFDETFKRLKIQKGNPNKQGFSLADVWKGDDPNAQNKDGIVQTIFRHGNSATIISGAVGRTPPTLWFMTYAGVERLYYNLVTQYRFWGDAHHRLETWQMMRRHRQEYEDGFIELLPEDVRSATTKSWTTSLAGRLARDLIITGKILENVDEKREVKSVAAIDALVTKLRAHIGEPSMKQWDAINVSASGRKPIPQTLSSFEDWEAALAQVTARPNQTFAQFLPDALYLKLKVGNEERVYSFLTHRGYDTHDYSVDQKYARNKEEDFLAVFPGVIGDFPNLMVDLSIADASRFLKSLVVLNTEGAGDQGFKTFQANFGMLRNNPNFWELLADIQKINRKNLGTESGLLDLNYYGGY